MGQQTGLHPVVVMVSIFFWGTALGGILGMIFGIPSNSIYYRCLALVMSKIFSIDVQLKAVLKNLLISIIILSKKRLIFHREFS